MDSNTPVKSIRKFCVECCGGSKKEVRECIMTDCELYPYRLGKNPNRTGIGNLKGNKNLKKRRHIQVF
jgi:hypothetical protein